MADIEFVIFLMGTCAGLGFGFLLGIAYASCGTGKPKPVDPAWDKNLPGGYKMFQG